MNLGFSVVIPTYNRAKNLELCIAALQSQKNPPPFEVIIADDGSTDNTRDITNLIYADGVLAPLRYIYCGPHLGFRPHRTRNIGIAQAIHPYIILLDSDVLLNPNALNIHAEIREKEENKDIVVIGMYHFAENNNINDTLIMEDYDNVEKLVPQHKSAGPPVPGIDCRIDGFTNQIITEYDGLGFFGGNQCWPVDVFWKLGGYDEKMPSGMGEDAELGQRMRLSKIPVMQHAGVYGIHIPHERNVAESGRLVQESIKYIDKKYEIGTYAKITNPDTDPREKDLSVWYTKDYNAKLVRVKEEPTVYAIDGTGKWYVGIPHPSWLNLLDFDPGDVKLVEKSYLDELYYAGTIRK